MSHKKLEIRELFADPAAYAGQTVIITGWARQIRDQKNFCFIQLNDGTY